MDISKIKNLVKQNGDKFIFVENGEPEIVVLSFNEYQKLAVRNLNAPGGSRFAEDKNKAPFTYPDGEDLEETEFMGEESQKSGGFPMRPEDIRLEDLPI